MPRDFLEIHPEDGIVMAEDRHYGPGDPIFDLHTDSITAYFTGNTLEEVRRNRGPLNNSRECSDRCTRVPGMGGI